MFEQSDANDILGNCECGGSECDNIVGSVQALVGQLESGKWIGVVGYADVGGKGSFTKQTRTGWGARRWAHKECRRLMKIRSAILQAENLGL